MALGKHYGAFAGGFAKSMTEWMKLYLMQQHYDALNKHYAAQEELWANRGLGKNKGLSPEAIAAGQAAGRDWDKGAGAPPSGSDFERVKAALTGTESGGNYNAVNSRTGATGRYQVMPFNIGPWTQKYLGKTMTQQEFRNSPEAQDKVFEGEMNAQYQKYGNWRDVVSVWHSGVPYDQAVREGRNDGNMSTQHYTDSILARASVAPTTAAPTTASAATAPTTTAPLDDPKLVDKKPEAVAAVNKALDSAKSMLGKNEVPNKSEIMSYLHDGGQDLDPHQSAWCAAFVSASLQKAGLPIPTTAVPGSDFGPGAYAGNYKTWGSGVAPKDVQAGDVLVSNDGGHVGFAEGPIRQGKNGPEVKMIAGNEKDSSGQYAPGKYVTKAGATVGRAQVGQVGERWVPLNQYTARRAVPGTTASGKTAAAPAGASDAQKAAAAKTADEPSAAAQPVEADTASQGGGFRIPGDTRTAAQMDQDSPAPPPGSAPPRNERALAPPQVAPPPPRPNEKIGAIPPGPVPAQDTPPAPTQAVRPEAPMATPLQAVRPEAPIPWSPQPIVNAARPDAPVDTRGVLPVTGARPDQPLPTRGVIAPSGARPDAPVTVTPQPIVNAARPDAPVSTTGLPPASVASEPPGTQFARPAPPAAPRMPPRTTTPATAYPPETIYGPNPRADTGARPDLTARSPTGAIPGSATASAPTQQVTQQSNTPNTPGFVQVDRPNADVVGRSSVPKTTALDLSHLWGPNPPLAQQTPGSSPGAAPTPAPTQNKNDFDVPPTPDFAGMTDEMVMGSAKGGPIQSSGAAANTRRSTGYARGGAIPTRPMMKLAMGGGADSYTPYTPGPAISSNSAVSGFTYNPVYSVGENLQQEKNQLLYGTTTPGASADFGAAWGKLTPAQQNWMTQASTVNTAAPYGSMEYNQLNANPISTPAPAPTPAAPAPAPAPAPVITPPTATNIVSPAATTTITDPTTTTTTGAPGLPNSIQAKSYDPNVDQQTGAGFANTSNVGGTDYSVGTDDLLQQNSKGQISGTNQNNTTILSRKGGPIPQSRRRPTLHLPTRVKFDDGGGVSPSFAGMPPGLGGQQAIPPIYFNPATYAGMGAPVGKGITNTSAPTFSAGAIPSLPMARGGRVGFAAGGGVAPRADASYTRIGYDDGGDVGGDMSMDTSNDEYATARDDQMTNQLLDQRDAQTAADNAPLPTNVDLATLPARSPNWYYTPTDTTAATQPLQQPSQGGPPPGAAPWTPELGDGQGNPSRGLIAAIGDGLHWLGGHLGLVGGAQAAPAIASHPDTQTNRANFASGQNVGGMDKATFDSAANTIDPNNSLNGAERQIAVMEGMYKYMLTQGDSAGAGRMAASILQYSVQTSQKFAEEAAKQLYDGNLQGAVDNINHASDAVPDGRFTHVTLNSDGTAIVTAKGTDGRTLWQQKGSAEAILQYATNRGRTGQMQWDALESQAAKYDPTFADMKKARNENIAGQTKEDQITAANAKFAPTPRPVTPRVTSPAMPGPGAPTPATTTASVAPATTTATTSAAPTPPAQPTSTTASAPAIPSTPTTPLAVAEANRASGGQPPVDTTSANAAIRPPVEGAGPTLANATGPTRIAAAALPSQPSQADVSTAEAQPVSFTQIAASLDRQETDERGRVVDQAEAQAQKQYEPYPDQSLIKTPADQRAYNDAVQRVKANNAEVDKAKNEYIVAGQKAVSDRINADRANAREQFSQTQQTERQTHADTAATARMREQEKLQGGREQAAQDAARQAETRKAQAPRPDTEVAKTFNFAPDETGQLSGHTPTDYLASAYAAPDPKNPTAGADAFKKDFPTAPAQRIVSNALVNGFAHTHGATPENLADVVTGIGSGKYQDFNFKALNDDAYGRRFAVVVNRPQGGGRTTIVLPEDDLQNLTQLAKANIARANAPPPPAAAGPPVRPFPPAPTRAPSPTTGQGAPITPRAPAVPQPQPSPNVVEKWWEGLNQPYHAPRGHGALPPAPQ